METKRQDLATLREQIDSIDRQIVSLFESRMDVCSDIAEYKIKTGSKVYDAAREQEKLEKVKALTHNDFNGRGAQELFEQLMAMSRKLQYQRLADVMPMKPELTQIDDLAVGEGTRVVFQGAEGSYSQAATIRCFGEKASIFNVDTFREAMSLTCEGKADYAVLPIENSTAGIVNEIYDLLVEYDNYIVGEQILPVVHCLLGYPGADMESIKKVYAHPQALMQSAAFLSEYSWEQVGMKNNAFAAMKVRDDKDITKAAVASEYAGNFYGLDILKKGINQSDTNATRFIVVTNKRIYRKDAKTVSICFEVPHKSGSLYHILSHFIYNDLNMTRIESRPIAELDWEYRFFVDFEGNLSDGAVKNALLGLYEEARNLKVLGNY